MIFPNHYKCLSNNIIQNGAYKIIPIRYEDRLLIMKWRNEQIYHLRQSIPLTEENQNKYFCETIAQLFLQENPDQILFSYLLNEQLVADGGLVHINWIDMNAEISFIINTELEKTEFKLHWVNYLRLIEQIAFKELTLHKIYTYAFDLRPHLYEALLNAGFEEEARLKEHCFFDGKFIDVIIHTKKNSQTSPKLRKINHLDCKLLFDWANDELVRENSLNSEKIVWDKHVIWFNNKLNSDRSLIFILEHNNNKIGQIRIDKTNKPEYWLIDYSIDIKYRGKGYGYQIVKMLLEQEINKNFIAFVKKSNFSSLRVFQKCQFKNINIGDDELIQFTYVHK